MTTHASSGYPTIAKGNGNNKKSGAAPRAPHGLWQILALLLGLVAGRAAAIPVTIAWDVPLNKGETYVLEVAKDPGFGEIALTTTVKGTGHLWNAPGEAVYHWRLARPRQQDKGDD